MRTLHTGSEQLHATTEGGVGTIVFDNQARMNALSMGMQQAVVRTLDALDADDEVRVVVLKGAGEKAFVSGADISEFGEKRTSPEARAVYDETAAAAGAAYGRFSKPLIAQIRGWCLGGGLITALRADIRIAADDARFGIPAARMGLGYAMGGVEQLEGLIGAARTAEILFTADRFDAHQALAMGLVNRVVSVEDWDDTVTTMAVTIAGNAPLTIAAIKGALQELARPTDRQDRDRVAALIEACFRSDDYREGQKAFAEKRPPSFTGH
ncbi:MAG: enoyl-CoA hydratase [Actinomycetia bacterium]|nr:enoyl-CoA hydratase [Actinomycetes bacterium]